MQADIQQAWKLFQAGQFDDALKISAMVCKTEMADADAAYLHGCCLSQLGRYSDAVSAFEQSLQYEPGVTDVYMAIAAALLAQKKTEAAASCYEKVIQLDPVHLHARIERAKLLIAAGKFDAARMHLNSAQQHNSDSGLPFYVLGLLGRQTSLPKNEIQEYFLSAITYQPEVAEFQFALGECMLTQEKYDEAEEHFKKACLIEPHNPMILSGLAMVSVKQGNTDFAIEQIDKLQARGVYMPEVALSFLLCCKHAKRCDDAIKYAQTCLDDTKLAPDVRRNIHSKLASVYDNNKQYEPAWHHLIASKDDIESHTQYQPAGFKTFIDSIIETFNFANMLSLPKADIEHSCSPVFIIGMPRSGTSLVEQILSAHTKVTGGGELIYMQALIENLPAQVGGAHSWPACILDAKQDDINILARTYLDKIKKLANNTPCVTDKMPHNFYTLGLIRLLFPKAKIIHCTRDPLDTCISIYFQNFKEGHPYAKNLFYLGTHYHQYQRLMEHWETTLSFNMFEIKYENLVQNPEESIRKMLSYCDLDWEENCLSFNKLKRYVLTASFDQVRQPLHTRSVNRWQHYEQYLDDLKEGIQRGF